MAAAWLNLPISAVREGIAAGELPAISIGGLNRLSRSALLAKVAGSATTPPSQQEATGPKRDDLPRPAGLEWVEPLAKAPAFVHHWPKSGGGSADENYEKAGKGTVTLAGQQHEVVVGESIGAQRNDGRRRLSVFFDHYPTAEFVSAPDEQTRASLLKPNGKKMVSPGEHLPALYRHARLIPYQQATGLSGSGRPRGLAVVIRADDLESAVHHAAARWLGRNGHSLEPAA